MPESEEENKPTNFYMKGLAVAEPVMMTMDLDLDGSWSFDQIFSSDPSPSSFLLSATEQSFSPLWAFSDDVVNTTNTIIINNNTNHDDVLNDADNKPLALTSSGGGQRLVSDADNPETKKQSSNDVKRRLPMPILEVNPSEYQDAACIIKERMTMALRYFIELGEKHVLAQIWAPVKNKGRNVLTTSGQPFVLDPNCTGLHQYRMASLMYVFSLDGETDGVLGLPGRVFRHKLPEWTPNVQYYSDKEYQRLNHALSYNVRGTLALPVFEPSGQSCVGVLELILTSQKINYAPEVDKVCKALEAVNLKSSNILDSPNTQICNESRQQALAEILEVLAVVCETHNFPLAQTWVPCRHRSVLAYGGGFKKSCSSFDGSCMGQVCMSTTDVAFYVVDAHMWGFREACAEHHLQKGQGVAGQAFATRSSCFCENITHFGKTEYPLVHYARLFGLVGSFAICLRSSYTGDDDYILEFFLPPNMVDCNDQQTMLRSLLTSMKQHFRTLKVASGEEIGEDGRFVEIIKPSVNGDVIDSGVQSIRLSESIISNGGPLVKEPNALNGNCGKSENVTTVKKSERKRGKAEKSISLEVLQQHFAGSLKDAAKNLGVCPTTMKRICRQHGISRWPSRKINKVNRSLTKLKRVIESVQGGEGTFTIPTLAATQLPLGDDSPCWPMAPNGSPTNQQVSPGSIVPYEPPYTKNDQGPTNQTSGSREASAGSPNSQRSSQESLRSEVKTQNVAAELSISDALVAPQTEEPLRGMLIEDAGSSHDLTNLCPVTEPLDKVQQLSPKVQPFIPRTDMKTITIKASYREDIIRFRVAANSGIVNLKEEVAKRLKLDVGTFDIKYLDDDHEWVLIVCDADLQECVELSISSGCNIIRLLVHDLSTNLGSSCESSD
uniref:protein NLP7-like isoform X2 n=1 Tax=Erigeron canadensis TaxID=72917 RepID=UPI001CB93220|nr:protein NLP7-like isoform X2 [Erigeron canadensis]